MSEAPAAPPGYGDDELRALATRVAALCASRRLWLTTAESCTGGWVAKACTDLAGSSEWFGTGFVTYSNAAKTALLGVPEQLLRDAGAVSEPVVRAMAEGALGRAGADLAVAISGIAGPSGGSAAKPVGTVWFAWSRRDAGAVVTTAVVARYDGDREAVRRQAVAAALSGLLAE